MACCRADLRVYVYDCPKSQREAAASYLTTGLRDFQIDWSDSLPPELEMDRPYTLDDAPYGALDQITAELRQAAPGASFMAWTDPAGEGPGQLIAYAPGLGEYTAACDAGGEPLFSREQITDLIGQAAQPITGTAPAAQLAQIKDAVYRAMGGPWLDHFEQHAVA